MDVEVPPVEVEDRPAVHHLTPFERTKYLTRPTQLLKRSRVDLTSVIHGEVPVTVRTKVATGSGPAEVHRLCVGESPAHGNNSLDELIIRHVIACQKVRTYCCGPSPAARASRRTASVRSASSNRSTHRGRSTSRSRVSCGQSSGDQPTGDRKDVIVGEDSLRSSDRPDVVDHGHHTTGKSPSTDFGDQSRQRSWNWPSRVVSSGGAAGLASAAALPPVDSASISRVHPQASQ